MIKNDRQLSVTRSQRDRLAADADSLRSRDDTLSKIRLASLESDISRLDSEMARYEDAVQGKAALRSLQFLQEAGMELVQARLACGLTQKQLADRLGSKEQQVQRYERTYYSSASLRTVTRVAQLLKKCAEETHI